MLTAYKFGEPVEVLLDGEWRDGVYLESNHAKTEHWCARGTGDSEPGNQATCDWFIGNEVRRRFVSPAPEPAEPCFLPSDFMLAVLDNLKAVIDSARVGLLADPPEVKSPLAILTYAREHLESVQTEVWKTIKAPC